VELFLKYPLLLARPEILQAFFHILLIGEKSHFRFWRAESDGDGGDLAALVGGVGHDLGEGVAYPDHVRGVVIFAVFDLVVEE